MLYTLKLYYDVSQFSLKLKKKLDVSSLSVWDQWYPYIERDSKKTEERENKMQKNKKQETV